MSFEWLSAVTNISELITRISKLVKNNRARKDLLLRELKLNVTAFEIAQQGRTPNYDRLLELLNNQEIKQAREENFPFSRIKSGRIKRRHIQDKRNDRYLGKTCAWLFKNIDEKIESLRKQKGYHGSLNQLKPSSVALQFSNLFYKMKLLAEFVSD